MRDLERVGGFLDQVLRRLGVPEQVDVARLVETWEDLAGEPWGSRSRPVGLNGGELVVEVDDGSIATLLKYQQKNLLERLERRFGTPVATSVKIRVSRGKKGS
jgi:predicted nucleic acid-binding Zn ribbon protein